MKNAQIWVNNTYQNVSGYVPCAEDGITGWQTMYSLTRGLQHELGITALSDNFGSTTMSLMTTFGPISKNTTNENMRELVEAALYCKGYSGGVIDGTFGSSTQSGLIAWKTDMGFAASGNDNAVSAKEMKTLLTMDAYSLLQGGDPMVRSIQQWMNATYIGRQAYQIVPCDGYYSRNVQFGLVLAIQYSIGMADGVANGNFGPGTRDGLLNQGTVTVGSTDSGSQRFVKLFKAALIFNGQSGVDWGSTTFTSATSTVATRFQAFCKLPTTGIGDYQTWCSLVVSTGDTNRVGKACDCATPLNTARAQAIKAAGYETVGRYISHGIINGVDKILTAAEIGVIFANGLSFFPIYQQGNNAVTSFTQEEGEAQAQAALAAARSLSLPFGTIIYFAVDYDATTEEANSFVTNFFSGVRLVFDADDNYYFIGVYGSRNVCSIISRQGYAVSSFVSGMSTGFSGNLGFSLPSNWAFDQISGRTLASGAAGQIAIDNDIKSGRDPGVSSLTVGVDHNANFISWVQWIEARAQEWASTHSGNSVQELTAQFIRDFPAAGRYDSSDFDEVSGPIDHGFRDYCVAAGASQPDVLRCPKTSLFLDHQHFGASLGSVFKYAVNSDRTVITLGDFGSWAGDLITASADFYMSGLDYSAAYDFAYTRIGAPHWEDFSFTGGDVLADVDAMVVGLAIRADPARSISGLLAAHYANAVTAADKYLEFINARFGSEQTFADAIVKVFTQGAMEGNDYALFREALWDFNTHRLLAVEYVQNMDLFEDTMQAFFDKYNDHFVN
ncbi:glycoside hydrolase domain-containing protein [Parafrankia sp. EUN1f]|uniref:glycoside hydrolase domain-containing protein n=1 Tax=Parafrankia sp. EUN1f TaxID=102897 RepID=UPI001E55135E|nr:glycoside hydrolase domain-containing protein [Parafrankia sp. EUN1f]